jgi:predicted nucleotidyltransferase
VKFEDLPEGVEASLHSLARDANAARASLLVFGSFARGDARRNSDLDIGFVAPQGGDGMRQMLAERIWELPTIRPIDLVDFGELEPEFRAIAERDILAL